MASSAAPTRVHPARLLAAFVSLCALWLLLSGCVGPQEQPLPEGVNDPREDLVERIKEKPEDLDAHADLLRLQIKSGDVIGADATVAHALKYSPRDFRAHLLAAQFHRWQLDLINAEKALITARDLAPDRLEPRVALAGLYNQAYLEANELEQRRKAVELADARLRPEFALDLAYSLAALLQTEEASRLAAELVADKSTPAGLRARAHLLLAEIGLRTQDEAAATSNLKAAFVLDKEDTGTLQFAARAITLLKKPAELGSVFDETLAGKDRAELRWTALFGEWMLAICGAAETKADPLGEPVEAWRKRLEAMEPGHPDVSGRYYQLIKLQPGREAEANALAKELDEGGSGAPPSPSNLDAVLSLWRAEDALRLGAPAVTLSEATQLSAREGNLEGLRMLRVMALFKLREDVGCLQIIDSWLAEGDKPDDLLLSLRWWVMLRSGKSVDVLRDMEQRGGSKNNSRAWIEAVAKFQTYRKG